MAVGERAAAGEPGGIEAEGPRGAARIVVAAAPELARQAGGLDAHVIDADVADGAIRRARVPLARAVDGGELAVDEQLAAGGGTPERERGQRAGEVPEARCEPGGARHQNLTRSAVERGPSARSICAAEDLRGGEGAPRDAT